MRPPASRLILVGGVTAGVIALDQLTKWWALRSLSRRAVVIGPVRLAVTHNRGAAFGLGTSLVPLIVVAAVVCVVVLVGVGRVVRRPVLAAATALVLGGAAANLGDRLFRGPGLFGGAVVDFIDLRWWPVFNLADTAITIGCVLLLLFGREATGDAR